MQLEELYTLASMRKQGMGGALVGEAARRAEALDPQLTFLRVDVSDGPVPLYERLGFEAFGQTTTFGLDRTDEVTS